MSGYPLARSEGIVTEELGDELVAYVEATQTAHALSKDAAAVWRHCDGDSSGKDIAGRLGLEHARVEQALEELSAAELIEEPEGISRRALYKRAATLGAAAVSAPLIYSVAISPSSAHASGTCTVSGLDCNSPTTGVTLSNGTCAKPCPLRLGLQERHLHRRRRRQVLQQRARLNRCTTNADCQSGTFCATGGTVCTPTDR